MQVTDYVRLDNARLISGTLRPSGRFSVCQIFPKKCTGAKYAKVQEQKIEALRDVSDLDTSYRAMLDGHWVDLQSVSSPNQSSGGTLGSSIAPNSPKRSRRGSRGITARQRDVLCWSANVLERVYGQKNLSFLTLTLPDLSERDFDAVRSNWSDIVHRVVLRIKEKLNEKGFKSAVVGCCELQLERAQSCRRYYPHLHLVFRGRAGIHHDWAIKPHQFRRIWRQCVSKFLSDGVRTWEASENVSQVRKSVGGYIAKYVSKCASKSLDGVLDLWHPSDWILVSRVLRGLYERLTYKGYELGHTLLALVNNWQHRLGYKQPIVISTPAYGDRTIGQWGWLRGEFVCPSFAQIHPT